MKNRDSNNLQQPVGICHRFFNFIMSSLFARSLKRVTSGDSLSREPKEMLLTGSSRSSSDHSGGEILVEFRHSRKEDKVGNIEGKAAGKRVAFWENGEEKEKNRRPEKRVLTEKLKPPPPPLPADEGDTEIMPRRRIILNNINTQSDEFIRKKKADLIRTTSLEKV